MSKRVVYEEVKARLLDKLPTVKTIRLWNNQITNENVENPFLYPAVFIEFPTLDYINNGSGLQQISGVLRLHIVQEEYKTENIENLDFIDLVAGALNGYQTATIIKPLWRNYELFDTNHNNLIVTEQEYILQANDCTSSKYNDAVLIDAGTVEPNIDIKLIIDNEVIRTGALPISTFDNTFDNTFN